jgi:hypothetical protein
MSVEFFFWKILEAEKRVGVVDSGFFLYVFHVWGVPVVRESLFPGNIWWWTHATGGVSVFFSPAETGDRKQKVEVVDGFCFFPKQNRALARNISSPPDDD